MAGETLAQAVSDRPAAGPGTARGLPRQVQWVIKVSKLCNLRCNYCYEYPSLSDRRRMSPEQLRSMFVHIAETYAGSEREMSFVWHGGEPLLIEPSYYDEVFSIQKAVLEPAGISFSNAVQTNLTFLSDQIITLLKKGFSSVGVSLDLFGSERVGPGGTPFEDRVVANLQRLREAGVYPGCITVLSRATVNHVHEIYRFYETIGLSFRLLPIYRTGYPGQQARHALSPSEISAALIEAADLWFASESEIQVRPIHDYVINAIRWLFRDVVVPQKYTPGEAEAVFIVDTDGGLHTNGDAYDPRFRHGNIFEQSFAEMRQSPGYRLSVLSSTERMAATCGSCQLHGACSGFYMGQATPEQRIEEDGKLICSVARPVQDYIRDRLRDPVLLDALMERGAAAAGSPSVETPEL